MQRPISVGKLTEAILRKFPVWEFTNDDDADETMVRPVGKLPADSGENRLFGCEVRFADGSLAFGLLGNASLTKSIQNAHFLTLSVFFAGREHYLPRYHDFDFKKRGPAALAKTFGKKIGEVFPISYDLSAVAKGRANCIRGSIPAKPAKKLSRGEMIKLALE